MSSLSGLAQPAVGPSQGPPIPTYPQAASDLSMVTAAVRSQTPRLGTAARPELEPQKLAVEESADLVCATR